MDFASHFNSNDGKLGKRGELGNQVSLIFVDINFLKLINDDYGHNAGDEYLKKTVSFLKTVFKRKTDRIFRFGGDEFVIAVEFVPPNKRERFNSFLFSSIGYDVIIKDPLLLNFAYGVSHTDPHKDSSIKDTLNRADAAMYENKRAIKAAQEAQHTR